MLAPASQWRISRSRNDTVSVASLCDALKAEADKKTLPWDWHISEYNKSRRSQGPDRSGLEFYLPLLCILVALAPRCQPGHICIQESWLWLHKRYRIGDGRSDELQDINVWADTCAGRVRLMLKHLKDLRHSNTSYLSPDLLELVGRVDIGSSSDLPSPSPPPPPPVAERPSRELRAEPSNASSLELCSWCCNCPLCRKPVQVSDTEPRSPTSEQAEQNIAIPALRKRPAAEDGPAIMKKPVSHKKPAAAEEVAASGAPDVKIKRRMKGPRPEAYVLLNGRYVAGLSSKHPGYLGLVDRLAAALRGGECEGREAGKAFLRDLVADSGA